MALTILDIRIRTPTAREIPPDAKIINAISSLPDKCTALLYSRVDSLQELLSN